MSKGHFDAGNGRRERAEGEGHLKAMNSRCNGKKKRVDVRKPREGAKNVRKKNKKGKETRY